MTRGDRNEPCPMCAAMDPDDVEALQVVDALLDGMKASLLVAAITGDADVLHPCGAGVGPCSERVALLVKEAFEDLPLGKVPALYLRDDKAHGRSPGREYEVLPDWVVHRISYGPMPGGKPGEFRVELAVQNKEGCS